MGAVVIATYKVKEANLDAFLEVLREKHLYLLNNNYITTRQALLLQSKIETEVLLEMFEWHNEVSSLNAHEDGNVLVFWKKMEQLWENGGFGLNEIEEAEISFPHFSPLDIYINT
jgi:hypothetical protein